MRPLRKFLNEMDLFAAQPLLRSQSQPVVGTLVLGFFSLILLGLFIWLLIFNLINSLNLDSSQIKVQTTIQKSYEPKDINNIMIAITFYLYNQTSIQNTSQHYKYFTIRADLLLRNQVIFLQKCKPQHWTLLGDNYNTIYKQYLLNQFYCLPQLLNLTNISYANGLFLRLTISPCNSSLFSYCKSNKQIQEIFNSTLKRLDGSFLSFMYILNPVPVVSSPDPIKYSLLIKLNSMTSQFSQIIFWAFKQIVVETQKSIFNPFFPDKQTKIVHKLNEEGFYQSQDLNLTDQYPYNSIFQFKFQLDPTVTTYSRTVNTIDDRISYVGGLLGIVLIFFSYILGSQAEYRYEIRLAENSFNYNSNGYKIRQTDITIWLYIKYTIFDWIKYLTAIQPEWKFQRQFDRTRQCSISMIDVQKLFRRLQFIERVIKKSNQDVFRCISLIQPDNIHQVKKKRNVLQYYMKVIKFEKAATVYDAVNDNADSFEYLGKFLDTNKDKLFQSRQKKQQKKKLINPNFSLEMIAQDKKFQQIQTKIYEQELQIKNSLINDLGLKGMDDICEAISYYPLISKQAQQVDFENEYNQVENQITNAFINLNITLQQKRQLVLKTPIILLHRLRLKARQMNKKVQNNENKINNKDVPIFSQKKIQNFTTSLELGLSKGKKNYQKQA